MSSDNFEWEMRFDQPQAGAPKAEAATDLAQAIDWMFEYPKDGLSVIWCGREVRIPYVYGLSDILDDLLEMLEALMSNNGTCKVAFTADDPDGLDADWTLCWENDSLVIDAEWRSAWGGLAEGLMETTRISVAKTRFVQDWIRVLLFLSDSVTGFELELEHEDEVDKIVRLATTFQEKSNRGG